MLSTLSVGKTLSDDDKRPLFPQFLTKEMVIGKIRRHERSKPWVDEPASLTSAFFKPAFFSPELSYSSSLLLPRLNNQIFGFLEGLDDSPVIHYSSAHAPLPSTSSICDGEKRSVCQQAGVVSPSKALHCMVLSNDGMWLTVCLQKRYQDERLPQYFHLSTSL